MKKKLLVASLLALAGTGVMAQSAFEGFYGQVGTGYESNSVSGLNGTVVESNPAVNGPNSNSAASNQTFSGTPLVIGAGYNFSVAPKWLVGLGIDYSALSQTSSNFNYSITGGNAPAGLTANGANIKVSNRYNIFIAPGYEIDKDKLVYLKAGYSSVQVQGQNTSSFGLSGVTISNAVAGVSGSNPASQTVNGYVLGLGYKQMIAKGFYGFAEGNYMTYSKASVSVTNTYTDGTGRNTVSYSPSLSSYLLLVGVGYKF